MPGFLRGYIEYRPRREDSPDPFVCWAIVTSSHWDRHPLALPYVLAAESVPPPVDPAMLSRLAALDYEADTANFRGAPGVDFLTWTADSERRQAELVDRGITPRPEELAVFSALRELGPSARLVVWMVG